MGHKVHPNGFRLGVYRNWEAKWFAPDKEYKPLLLEDVRLRRMLMIRLKNAGLARIETERSSSALTITLHTAKPGIVIGEGRVPLHTLKADIDFGQTEAKTTFGRIGVSAWVYTGNFPTEAPPKPAAAAEEPADAGVPVGVAIGVAPSPLAELVQAAVPAPAPQPAPAAAPAPVTAEAPAAKPKRTTRATKAADTGEKPAAKRATRARATTTEKADAPKAPRARATKKKE